MSPRAKAEALLEGNSMTDSGWNNMDALLALKRYRASYPAVDAGKEIHEVFNKVAQLEAELREAHTLLGRDDASAAARAWNNIRIQNERLVGERDRLAGALRDAEAALREIGTKAVLCPRGCLNVWIEVLDGGASAAIAPPESQQ